MRKSLCVLIVAMLCVAPAFSGGKKQSSEQSSKGVQLQLWMWDATMQSTFQRIVDEYQKTNPQVKITVTVFPWSQYWTKLEAAVTGGVAGDLFWMNAPNLIKYSTNDLISPATDIYTEELASHLAKVPKEIYQRDGEIWGVPAFYDTIGMVYNKEIFDRYGVEYPTNDWNWSKFIEIAEALRQKMPSDEYPVMANAESQTLVYPIMSAAGAEVISADKRRGGFDSAAAVEAFTRIKELGDRKLITPPALLSQGSATQQQLFFGGKVGMWIAGAWWGGLIDSKVTFPVGTVELPSIVRKGNVTHAVALVANKNSPHLAQAKEFLKFFASPETSRIIAESGLGLPVNPDYGEVYAKNFHNLDITPYVRAVAYATPYPYSYNTDKWVSVLEKTTSEIISGNTSVADGLAKIETEMNKILAEENY